MHDYELMLVLHPDLKPEDEKKRDSIVTKLLTSVDHKISEISTIGRKRLAYKINKQTEGIYVLIKLSGRNVQVAAIEKQIKLMPEILRFLLLAA